ncbi:site-2 protease family protein [Singulisphaera rosea]
MLGMASPTAYDLNFRLLGIPVRVHPLFWLIMVLLSGQDTDLRAMLIFVAAAFLSILVHEFGHGLMSRVLGYRPTEIVLYGMGGYCLCDLERQGPWQKLAVLFAGPGAGFLLAVLALVVEVVAGHSITSEAGHRFLMTLITINLFWGIVNLFPIWPLDGGRMLEVILLMFNRRNGTRWAHVVALLTAGGLAVFAFNHQQIGLGIWFVYFGFMNYQVLQAHYQSSRYGSEPDDADWWKR